MILALIDQPGASVQDVLALLLNCSVTMCVALSACVIVFIVLWLTTKQGLRYYQEQTERYRKMYDEINEIMQNHECCTCCGETPVGEPPYPEGETGIETDEDWWREGDQP